MTVIVGLEASAGDEKIVVIGADRLNVNGDLSTAQFLRYVNCENPNNLSFGFDFLEKTGMDKIKLKFGPKIKVSKNRDALLAHTGVNNEANQQVSKLLLNPEDFLKQDAFLMELLSPFKIDPKITQEILSDYRSSFDLKRSLGKGYVPEIRRIFDMAVAKEHKLRSPLFRLSWWDRNYNAALSEYLFSSGFNFDDKSRILLLDISLTGALTRRQYYAKGYGGKYALEYMRDRLGTRQLGFFHDSESLIERDISLDEAVDIVTNAINFANKKSDFCRGLDYAIITSKGIDTHFSNEQGEYEISLMELINRRTSNLRTEINQLKTIKQRYNQRK